MILFRYNSIGVSLPAHRSPEVSLDAQLTDRLMTQKSDCANKGLSHD